MRAFIGLGTNLGDRRAHLRSAVDALRRAPGVNSVRLSPVYETEPVGGPEGQGPYLNAVAELDTTLDPRGLLELCRALESAAGRVRAERWGPRTLDADVLLVGDSGEVAVDEPDLTVPHPRMWERRFVVAPLADLAPDLVPDGWAARIEGDVRRTGNL